ncbi:UDP-galactopyranose mutase [Enterococcus faecium]|nr:MULTISPECIES: UDP-galactopyranose mutase [Enterococcus]EOK70287.1 UDP-galactopyranose mutase [Enterococcus faecium EnGen0125]EOK75859.1 UDP-galactopyranose mutase [Enterococcus faecium EnGen0145]OTO99297.1 UDP-galactopyranose mutase [Enterococcus faecium]OTP03407.1 UDP-galactopyranose mutase [Enterococcus faecium]RBS67025.1 UDP-galactopyranose mutase [Enterococcus faecium]
MNRNKDNNVVKKILVVGAGLFGSVFAHEAAKKGYQIKVIEKRNHVAGNIYTKEIEGIQFHQYGAHIFHTSNKEVWDYVNQFAEFNRYTNSPVANYHGEIYNLPFNMNTFNKLWGVVTPKEAQEKIDEQRAILNQKRPENLEEQAISLVGTDIYEKLIKGYTEKQWGRPCTELPPFIIKRLPVRMTYDNNYFNDKYQGIPIGGYTQIVEKMLDHPNIEVHLNTDFFDKREQLESEVDKVVYTGMIDQFFDYKFGRLEYRSLSFENEILDQENYQGNAVVNYTDTEHKYTRIIEHKHFEFGTQPKTIITKEYPIDWKPGDEPYYPVNDKKNNKLYKQYKELADQENKYIFGGRLGMYKYFDMHMIIHESLKHVNKYLGD